jgi:catechol 2,3-dioxygenase-like lactoylglutathione lyase family enzyme
MLKQVYVIDMIVKDIDKAIVYFKDIMGVDPINTTGVGTGVGDFRMVHFPAPGEGVGIHSIGLFQLTTDTPQTDTGKRAKKHLEEHGEGVFLFGFMVDNIDKTQKDMEAKGYKFNSPEPQSYQMGRGNSMEEKFGTTIWYAQHNPDGYQTYRNLEKKT